MGTQDYITTIDTTYTDDVGNNLIWSNDVLSVFYYNATTTGTEEDWTKDWNYVNYISNPNFSTTITGSDWVFETDSSGATNSFDISRFGGWNDTDLLRDMVVTSSGYSTYTHSNLVDFKQKNGWRTSSAAGDGAYAAKIDMGSSEDVNYVWVLPGFDDDDSTYLKDYRIGVSDTGDENDFTIVASDTTTSGSLEPHIHFIGNLQKQYIKIFVDSNWGSSSYTYVGKLSAFYDPDWSMFGYHNTAVNNGGTYAQWKQDVNFSFYDYLFVDVRAFMINAYQIGSLDIMVDSDVIHTYDWSSTGLTWIDSNDDDFWTRWEEECDVSSYSGSHELRLRMWSSASSSGARDAFMGFFDTVATQPAWYSETPSSYRGTSSTFPDEVYIFSDRSGISIVDKSTTRLWMRFQIGIGFALESIARDVNAKEGKVYLATPRGLIVIDFKGNRIWKYSEDGIEYRMSIKRRNEYAQWYNYSSLETLSSSDTYSVSIGTVGGTDFVVVGTSIGLSYVVEETTINNSSFSYPVRKVKVDSTRLYYIGGYDSKSRFGAFEDLTDLQSDNFIEDKLLFSDHLILQDDLIYGEYLDQWRNVGSTFPFSFEGSELTLSGTKRDVGTTSFVQATLTPDRPFVATIKVKVSDWPDRVQGGFHFGLNSGWPHETVLNSDGNNALMLSALNGIDGIYFENEKFSSFPSGNRWVLNYSDSASQRLEYFEEQNSFRVNGYFYGSAGVAYSPMAGIGSKFLYTVCPDFIAKVKVKFTDLYEPDSSRVSGIVFGVTDGQYLGEGSGVEGLSMAVYRGNVDPNPAVYCVATKSTNNGWTFDTTNSGTLLSGDGTETANWHTWEISYNSSSQTIVGTVDGTYVGSKTNLSLNSDIGIIMGPVGNDPAGHIESFFKDFQIDFGEIDQTQKEKYVLQKVESDVWTSPTVSGTHLDGIDFSSGDGTDSALYKTWQIEWDGVSLLGSVDGEVVGSTVTSDLGDQPTVFFAYNMPATLSGNTTTDIRIKEFSIEYNDEDTVISGSPNNFYPVAATYSGSSYNTLYISTTSGINQMMYNAATSVSGTPVQNITYGIEPSGAQVEVLHGNIKNCSGVETDSAGPDGILYTSASRFTLNGWERVKDRPGEAVDEVRAVIGATEDGTKLFLAQNRTGAGAGLLRIYRKYINGEDGGGWSTIFYGDQTEEAEDVAFSRVYMVDPAGQGLLYCVGPNWLGIYNVEEKRWENPDVNIGNSHGSEGLGTLFDDWEIANALARKEFFIAHYGDVGKFSVTLNNWITGKYFYGSDSLPLTTADPAIVYSEVDDSLYMLQKSSVGSNFFRMPLSTMIWSEALSDSPYEYNFDYGIFGFYRPKDESVYYLFKGETDAYGRKLVRYDVKRQEWFVWGVDVPVELEDHMSAVYITQTDELYVVIGETSLRIYKYKFPSDSAPRFVSWSSDESLVPELSILSRYRKVSPSSGEFIQNDSLSSTDTKANWVDYISGAISITDGSNVSIYAASPASAVKGFRSQSIPMPSCNFTAKLNVRIKEMPVPNSANTVNSVYFGVSDHLGSPGFNSHTGESSEMGNTMFGVNGLWMVGYNTQVLSDRYSLWKRESGTDTLYGSSSYEVFNVNDATPSAELREWKIIYDHPTKTLSSYIDSSLIGTAVFTENGLDKGLMFNMGAWNSYTNVSGAVDTEMSDFDITFSDTTEMVGNYLRIYDNDEYGHVYYEKKDSTVSSGTGYAYESDWQITTHSVSSNVYVTSLGCMEDGNRSANLAAIYTGDKQIGLYIGGDPREQTSYSGIVTHDWTLRSTYKMVSDSDTIKVYIDGEASPSINYPYCSLPETNYRQSCFGSVKPNKEIVRNHLDNSVGNITISGTWSLDKLDFYSIPSFYGSCRKNTSGDVSDYVVFNFDSNGDTKVYVFYPARLSAVIDAPFTVYHSGVVDLPVSDSYATNPIAAVNDNIDQDGGSDVNATTIDVNQLKLSDGRDYNSLESPGPGVASGYVYIGTYTNVNRVTLTADATGTYTTADTVILTHCLEQPRARSDSRVYSVSYTVGEGVVYTDADFEAGLTVVDMTRAVKLDAYSDKTSPGVVDDNIYDFDVV